MSTSPSYVVFKCDVCQRQTEILNDGRRPDPLLCNITYKCRGKFQRAGIRSSKQFLFTPLVSGLQDYIQRGTTISSAVKTVDEKQISIFTAGGEGMITLAGIRRKLEGAGYAYYVIDENDEEFTLELRPLTFPIPSESRLTLKLFEITAELLDFKQYTYIIPGTAQIVSGPDNSPEQKNLRFNSTNRVRAFVNGVELESGEFDRSIDDQVTFTPAIYDTNNVVEIFVYLDINSAINEEELISIEFMPLDPTVNDELALRKLNCWGDFGGVTNEGVTRYLAFASDLSALDVEKTYGVAWLEAVSFDTGEIRKVKSSDFLILLGQDPFSVQDKQLFAYLDGGDLVDGDIVLAYKISDASGQLELSVSESTIRQVYNRLVGAVGVNISQTSTYETNQETAQGEPLKKKYILGPS